MVKYAHYLFAFVFFVLLSTLLGEWSKLGSHIHQLVSELPLLMLIYFLLFSMQKPTKPWLNSLLAVFPIALLYFTYDYFFVIFNRPFAFSELANLGEFFQVLDFPQLFMFVIVIFLPIFLILLRVDWLNKLRFVLSFIFFIGLVTSILVFRPQLIIQYVQAVYPGTFYHHTLIMDNGRFMATLYTEAKRRVALQDLKDSDKVDLDQYVEGLAMQSDFKRDIFVVVVESYFNHNDFSNIQVGFTDRNIEEFYKNEKEFLSSFKYSLSPVLGGQTPRAEFEILCGIPSYAKYGASEFNIVGEGEMPCLPNLLKRAGYYTVATNPYKPSYFNRAKAYNKIGFDAQNFLKDYSGNSDTYLTMPAPKRGEGFLPDKDLLQANIEYVRNIKNNHNGPIFNYVITIFGHTPFQMPPEYTPLLEVSPSVDPYFERALNMSVYTFKALKDYINALKDISPNSIILVVSDHLPPLPNGSKSYQDYGYLSVQENSLFKVPYLFLVDNMIYETPNDIKHFYWKDIILNLLNQDKNVSIQNMSDKQLSALYNAFIYKTINGNN